MSHQTVGRGGAIRLDATFQDGTGAAVDPTTPRLDILDALDVEVVTDAVPTRDAEGLYHYDYDVAVDAPLGVWTAHWTGTINGVPITGDDAFEVAAAGDVDFPPGDSLATLAEFEARIPGGISAADEARAQAALDDASALIRAEAGMTWADTDPPEIAKMVCIAAARRSFINPDAIRSQNLDGYAMSFASASPDVYLTAAERSLVRRAVGKSGVWALPTTRLADGEVDGSTLYLDVEPPGEPMPYDVSEPI